MIPFFDSLRLLEMEGHMKTILSTIMTGSLLASVAMAQPAPRYSVIDLGTLGGAYSYAYGMDNRGRVAGGSATTSQTGGVAQTAYLWYAGLMTNLGTLGGPFCPDCNSEGADVSGNGVVAVLSETDVTDPNAEDFCFFGTHRQCLGAVWSDGVLKPLPPLQNGHNAAAFWINNNDEVVGFAETGQADACATPFQKFQFAAVTWDRKGNIHQLNHLPGDTVSFAFANNENGEVVGSSGLCSNSVIPPAPVAPHAVLWQKDGTPVDLGSLGGTVDASMMIGNVASGVNNRGQVVGSSALPGNQTVHAFLWPGPDGKMQDLGTLDGDFLSFPGCCNTINDSGQIVGTSIGPNGPRGFLWENGKIRDLNTLIAQPSPYIVQTVASINAAGEIAANGVVKATGEAHGFLLTPR